MMKARLYEKYVNEVKPALKAKRGYTNDHQIPKLEKIVINMGINSSAEKGAMEDATVCGESRPVTRTIPGLVGVVPTNDCAEVRAGGRKYR